MRVGVMFCLCVAFICFVFVSFLFFVCFALLCFALPFFVHALKVKVVVLDPIQFHCIK